ncbi:MAG: trypsin-like peptidase domain-containing protein [Desulfobacterales bacterium]|nr:trypsin-like peptidase domain-containing protein [Desulfobacterales bacterium]
MHLRKTNRLTAAWRFDYYFGHGGLFVLVALVFLAVNVADAGVYKYKGANGVWYFTDTPDHPEEDPAAGDDRDPNADEADSNFGKDLGKQLAQKMPPQNRIEEARNATVSIARAAGSGSGFFISANGYIVTNRHVIDSSEAIEQNGSALARIKKELDMRRNVIDLEYQQLKDNETQLARSKDGMSSAEYRKWRRYIEQTRQSLRQREAVYAEMLAQYEDRYDQFRAQRFEELAQEGFEVILADQSRLRAEKVAVSETLDLALLKVSGYKTPIIPQGASSRLAHGQPLFAIGNSLNMGHTVTSGVFSGYRNGLIQTNAQINPGNSGGPLVTDSGQIVGVNTQKVVHQSVEGVGFAIPIEKVYQEFSSYVRR